MGPAILVTGGAGYVGSHACKALAEAGYLPIAYDNLSQGHRWAVRWGPLERGDLADGARLDEVVRRYQPAAVMHFAAAIAAGESVADPAKYYRSNVLGTLNLLEAMRRHAIERIVFSSTAAIFGDPQCLPIDERHVQAPINPYGRSKLACERMLADFAGAHGIRSVSLRYFNAAGADPDGELGEAHEPETHLIPLVLDAAAGRRHRIEIFGSGHATADGTCVRDYVHVSDLAAAHLLALRCMEGGAMADVFNLGNGAGFTVLEVIETARRITGRPIPSLLRGPRPGDPAALVADARRAHRELGWRPQLADLGVQIAHAWQWHCRVMAQSATGS